MVGVPAAGHHRVELLAGLVPGGQAVHGVDRDPLGGVHGGGVPQLHRARTYSAGRVILRWVRVCCTARAPVGGVQDGPPVTVLDPVGRPWAAGGRCGG